MMKCCSLKLSSIKYMYRSFIRNSSVVQEMLKYKTTDLDALIDPKVKNIKDKLLYSDYIECKRLKLGYRKNIIIKKKLEYKFKKEQELIENKISHSIVALNCFNKSNDVSTKDENCYLNVNSNQKKEPIHMPYANIDKYEKLSTNSSKDIHKESLPMINEKYKLLYEKYLDISNYTITNPNTPKVNDAIIQTKFKIRLNDSNTNISSHWMTDYEIYDDGLEENLENIKYGTSNFNTEVSSVPCGGCGALLHCKDVAIPGYLPSEIFMNKRNIDLKSIICQRCHFMKFYNTCLDVKVSEDEYSNLLKHIQNDKKSLVLLIVDLTDFPCSIWPQITSFIGEKKHIFVIGNKIDLLPQDSAEFLSHVKECLMKSLVETGISKMNIKHISLISAKTSFGVEELINKLHKIWNYRSDVYLMGCTNAGKSTLFNTLLQSDFCKSQAVDLVQRATTSQWPGTTLNMLKFPILRPTPQRLYLRVQKLRYDQQSNHDERCTKIREYKNTKNIELLTLQSRISHTFKKDYELTKALNSQSDDNTKKIGLDETSPEYKFSCWCYDTPGSIQPDQILHFLTTNELLNTLPNKIMSPRTFCIWSGETIFIAGLGRLDILNVRNFIRCTVFASNKLPITICKIENAGIVYNELLVTKAFVVPNNNPDRLRMWPKLKSKDLKIVGIGQFDSASDVVLSNAGWVAITADKNESVNMRAWTPEGRGIHIRTPALLPKSITLRGERKIGSRAYKLGKQIYF